LRAALPERGAALQESGAALQGCERGRLAGLKPCATGAYLLATLILAAHLAAASGDNWPQFRGAHAGVAADDPALPASWNATDHIVWKADVPGRGWSSPIVWGDHIFITAAVNTAHTDAPLKPVPAYTPRSFGGPMSARDITSSTDPHRWVVYDIDFKTGRIRWEATVRAAVPPQPTHQKNSYASETPATDGTRVYVYFGNMGLFAFDMNGKPVWSTPMGPFTMRTGWGAAASPIVHKDRVYIVNDNDDQSFIAAYDARTGAQIWKVNRDEGSNWTTPFVWEHDGRSEIVTTGTGKVRSYDLNGTLLWTLTGMSIIQIPTPFAAGGLLYISSGYPADALRPVYAIRPGASGDISLKQDETTNAFIAWSSPTLGTYNTSPLVYGDYYYTLFDRGLLACHDARTGREIYPRQRITTEPASFTASPWIYNGKIFAMSEDGDTYVMQAGSEFKVLGKNTLNEMTLATPAVANGSLIVRTASKLYRIGGM
jgi:outer membrane protein assembly factor BamB